MAKKRRATVIFENEEGILLTRISSEPWLLPGGHAEIGEPRIIAAIRELYEETRLTATEVKYLFDFESTYYLHKVFLIKAKGTPVPSDEVKFIKFFHPVH
jgi:8-oxo-dGTP diphosphatase